ncbi:MAG TPA: ATP-grasp domain-containing protein [Candidatus Binatia bacterium]
MDERRIPPDDPSDEELTTADWKTEYDVTATLEMLGHEVHMLGVGGDLNVIRRTIEEVRPDIVFNLLEDFHDVPIYDQNVVSYLEILRVPYTGCNPRGLMLARDKALSKALLASHRIPVPDYAVFRIGRRVRRPRRLNFPLIVKSLTKEGSEGIAQVSIVDSDEKLAERVRFVHERLGTHAIAERYIDGRELYVGVLGNERLQVFPVWELMFTRLPEGAPRIATERVKWNPAYQEKVGVRTAAAKNLPDELVTRIQRLAKRIYRTLQLSGYARIDLRLDAEGRVYVLEANPNPQIAYGEDFAESAEYAGIQYGALLQRIINLGLRWSPETGG